MSEDMLQLAIQSGIIDMSYVEQALKLKEKEKYLAMHKYKIWENDKGVWYTYVFDATKPHNRRLVHRKSQEALTDYIVNLYKEVPVIVTLQDVFDEWAKRKIEFGEIEQQTFNRYESDFRRFFSNSDIAKKQLSSIDEDELEVFIKCTIKEKNLTAKAWSGLRTILKGTFKLAKKKGYTNISITEFLDSLDLAKNGFKVVKKPDELCSFNKNEIALILRYLEKNSDSIINLGIALAFMTGMRVGEIAALKWEDVKEDGIEVHRTEIRYKDNEGNYVFEVRDFPKTAAGIRKIYLPPEAFDIIAKIRILSESNEFVFFKDGARIKEKAFTVKLYRVCSKLDIPRRSMHKIRATYATKLINDKLDDSIIINQLGHASITTSRKFYYKNDKTADEIKQAVLNSFKKEA